MEQLTADTEFFEGSTFFPANNRRFPLLLGWQKRLGVFLHMLSILDNRDYGIPTLINLRN